MQETRVPCYPESSSVPKVPLMWLIHTAKGTGSGQVQGAGLGPMGPNVLYRNVHIGLRQGN